MTRLHAVTIGLMLFALVAGCTPEVHEDDLDDRGTFALLLEEGLSCRSMQAILSLPEDEANDLRELVWSTMTRDQVFEMIDAGEVNCGIDPADDIGAVARSITIPWSGQFVPEASGTTGVGSTAVFRDSTSSSWMCNSGAPESPADYVVQYRVSGAYSNRAALRVRGTNLFASCYIQPSNASRVYTDNDIRMCVGYWHVFFCGAVVPLTSETRMWR